MIITVNRRVSQIVCEQKGAPTRRVYANNYRKCARQVLKMLDRVGSYSGSYTLWNKDWSQLCRS
jgi:hypothetical protein